MLLIVLYVDDLLIIDDSVKAIATTKATLHDRFAMTDMGLFNFFLVLKSTKMNQVSKLLNPSMQVISYLNFT